MWKKRLLRIFLFFTMLLSLIVPSENNGPRRVEAATLKTSTIIILDARKWGYGDARYAVHYWNGSSSWWYSMQNTDKDGYYYFYAEHDATNLIFCRMNGSTTDNNWGNCWNQTADLTWNGSSNLYTINGYSYGSWGTLSSTITYHLNGGSWNSNYSAPSSTLSNSNITLPTSSNISKTGYSFEGWYKESTFTNKVVSINKFSVQGNLSLYAKWSPISYDINYSGLEDATLNSANPSTYNIETNTFTLNNPSKTGYTFSGWTGSNGNNPSTSVSISKGSTGDKSYTANWEVINYSISYAGLENATITANPTSYNIETNTFTLNNPTKTGYTFTGWTGSNGSTPSKSVSISKGSTGNKTYTANWKINQYGITLNVNPTEGGTTTGSGTYDYNSQVQISATPNIGYQFTQWNDGDTNASRTITLGASNVTYTATFSPKEYTINFNAGDGNLTVDPYEIIYNNSIGTLPTPTPPSEEYIFLGWYLSVDADEANNIKDNTTLTASNFNITSNDTSELTLYAKYKQVATYTVSFDSNGGSEVDSITVYETLPYNFKYSFPTPTRTGYTFASWTYNEEVVNETDSLKVNGDHELVATWTANEYTVTLGQTNATTQGTTSVTATYGSDMLTINSLPTRTGYTFSGYKYNDTIYYNENGTSAHIWDIASNDITLTPIWTANTYTITFDEQCPTESSSIESGTTSLGVIYDAEPGDITPPSITGYTFNGYWTGTAGQGIQYYDEDGDCLINSYTVSDNLTLYAYWSVNNYAVTLITNGGSYNNDYTAPNQHTYDEVTTLPTSSNIYKTGYTFAGWYDNAECSGNAITEIPAATAEAKTYYAKWTINQYTISFNSNGGSDVSSITQDYASTVTKPTDPTKTGYTFVGWYSDSNLTNAYTFTTMPANNITLYAEWAPITYTIVLHDNLDSNITKNVNATYDQDTSLSFNSFSKTGYEIYKWTTNANGTGDSYGDSVTNLTSEAGTTIYLYAQWRIINYSITYEYCDPTDHNVSNTNPTSYTYESSTITLTDPTRPNYTFSGWTCSALGITEPTFDIQIPAGRTGNLTIVANWSQKVTVYIDMSLIYNQYYGKYSIDNPFVYYWNDTINENSGEFGSQTMTYVKDNIYKYDIYFTTNNVESDLSTIEYIIFGYSRTPQGGTDAERQQTNDIVFEVSGSNNGQEYTFVYQYSENAILKGFEVGKTYTITDITYISQDGNQKAKWFTYNIEESDEGTAGKTTFIIDLTWSNIGDVYIQPYGHAGVKATAITGGYKVELDYATYGNVTQVQCNFEQDSYWWWHLYDENNKTSTETYTYWSTNIYSIDIVEAPQVYYYDGDTNVYISSYLTNNQIKFIEKEGYRLEGWYLDEEFEELFTKETVVDASINVYAKYVEANDYYLYCDAKDLPWNIEEDGVNMYVYMYNSYFYEPDTAANAHENVAWGDEDYGGDSSIISYVGNGIYRVLIDASKSFNNIIFSTDDPDAEINQTADIEMSPNHTYYILTNYETKNSGNTDVYDIYYEENLDNFLVAQKNTSSDINEFRFTAGLETTTENGLTTENKEFGYKFIFIKDNSSYVGYWNFKKDHMLDCIRYEGTLNEAGVNNTYKGYYSLTLTDDITFKYGDYDQIIVIACYRDSNNVTRVIKAQEYNIIGTNSDVYLYDIER